MKRELPEVETFEPDGDEKVTLTFHSDGRQYDLPVLRGTHGPKVIDIQRLYRDTGYFTYDPGFMSTASCDSALTFIDGECVAIPSRTWRPMPRSWRSATSFFTESYQPAMS